MLRSVALLGMVMFALLMNGQARCLEFDCGMVPTCENTAGCLGDCYCDEGTCVSNNKEKE